VPQSCARTVLLVSVLVWGVLPCFSGGGGLEAAEASFHEGRAGVGDQPGVFVRPRPMTDREIRSAISRMAGKRVPPRMAPKVTPKYAPGMEPEARGASPAAPAAAAPALTVNFQGIEQSQFGTPADPSIAAGPNHVVQAINSIFHISNKSGQQGQTFDPVQLFGAFFTANPNTFPFDPWIVYDHFSNRFVMIYLAVTPTFSESWYLMAVSVSADPSLGWNTFVQRSDIDGMVDTAFWGDYEKLGFDNQNYYLTSNQFDAPGNFRYSKIRVMQKSQFFVGGGNFQFFDFINILDATGLAFTIQPCVTFGAPGKEYLVSAEFGGGNRLTLFSITGTWPNANNTPPVLIREGGSGIVNFNQWFFPPFGIARDSTNPVDAGDDRLLNAMFRNNTVYTAHSVGSFVSPCAAAVKSINVQTRTKVLDVQLGAPGEYWCWPSVGIDSSNGVAVVFNRMSPSLWLEVDYTFKAATDPAFQPFNVLKAGTGGYEAFRLGDYNGMAIDPTNNAFWFNGMFATGLPGGFGPETGYGTWVGSFRGVPTGGGVPSNVTATYNSGAKTLTLIGDDLANSLSVVRQGRKLTISGGSGTKINNLSTVSFNIGVAPINVTGDLKGGADTVSLISLSIDTIDLKLGDGNDKMIMNYCKVTTSKVDGGLDTDSFIGTTSKITSNQNTSFP
jgi:hypothetical protein